VEKTGGQIQGSGWEHNKHGEEKDQGDKEKGKESGPRAKQFAEREGIKRVKWGGLVGHLAWWGGMF